MILQQYILYVKSDHSDILGMFDRRATAVCVCHRHTGMTEPDHPSQCVFVSLAGQDSNDDTAPLMSMRVIFW